MFCLPAWGTDSKLSKTVWAIGILCQYPSVWGHATFLQNILAFILLVSL